MTRHIAFGCDPGAYGALAATVDGALALVVDLPVVVLTIGGANRRIVDENGLDLILRTAINDLVRPDDSLHFVLEEVGARPKEGPVGAFSFGRGYGAIRGLLAGLQIPRTYVPPANWKRELRMKKGKDASRQRASELYPSYAQSFARVKDDGRAEAALIAHWAHYHLYLGGGRARA